MNQGPFAVVAHRWGLRDAHSYVVCCCNHEDAAKVAAERTVDDRGGKYGVEVTDYLGTQIYYVESPYFGDAGRSKAATHPADKNRSFMELELAKKDEKEEPDHAGLWPES